MKASSRRPEQVGETLRQVITEALAREVRDPRVGFVTVTGVLVTQDLSHARIMVSVPGDDAGADPRARGAAERRRLPPDARRADAVDPDRAGAPFRARQGPAARRPDQRAARATSGARRHADRRGPRRQAGGTHVARRGAAGPPGPRHPRGRTHRDARSVRDRSAGRSWSAGRRGWPGSSRRSARRISPPRGWASRPTPTTSPAGRSVTRSTPRASPRRTCAGRSAASSASVGSGRRSTRPSTWRASGAIGWPGAARR